MGTDCPYRTLGVRTDATGDEIKTAYRAGLKAAHPDHGGDRRDLDRVIAAYEHLRRSGALTRRASRDDAYARTMRSLDWASSLTVAGASLAASEIPARLAHISVRTAPTSASRSPARFAELLQMELRRQGL
jgi:hypothetical protein